MKSHYAPMLAHTADAAFDSKDWIFEVKWDGIRAISYVNKEISIRTRNDKELKYNFPELSELASLAEEVVIDGEIVVINEGKSDFQAVIERAKATRPRDIEIDSKRNPATYVVFDILEQNGKSLLELPLYRRKTILEQNLKEGKHVVLSIFAEEKGKAYFEAAQKKRMEGIIAKKKDSSYEPGTRSHNWLKIKKLKTCDCVILGYTKGRGNRKNAFGSLILGLYERGKAAYVGNVGTGFSAKTLEELMKTLKELETKEGENSIANMVVNKDAVWIKPKLVCEVAYQNVTKDGRLRMPRFRGLRQDKKPEECTIDQIKTSDLAEYTLRRDFDVTPEPTGKESLMNERTFVVQEHHARRLHYDLRLQREGVLRSWAVPKGIPEKIGEKRLAVQTEDHPLEYRKFQGIIPEGQYGAGVVKIWDSGSFGLKTWGEDKIEFALSGQRLKGRYVLARLKKAGKNDWLLLRVKG